MTVQEYIAIAEDARMLADEARDERPDDAARHDAEYGRILHEASLECQCAFIRWAGKLTPVMQGDRERTYALMADEWETLRAAALPHVISDDAYLHRVGFIGQMYQDGAIDADEACGLMWSPVDGFAGSEPA